MTKKHPRYTVIGPPWITNYAIVDEWDIRTGMTTILEKRYDVQSKAKKDCDILNKAQKILSNLP